ncbi:MAG: alpha-amylase family glycosyl hydrolase [Caldilineales bacterium]|nr:alpha-amylase family glycosyl hydrolase [Caldilineales bacterium]
MYEFHIAREARDYYQFDQSIFTFSGNVVFADFYAARVFAQKMNARRDLVRYPEQAVQAGQVNAMGLIDEIAHLMVELYRRQIDPRLTERALARLEERLGAETVRDALWRFADRFPPAAVYRREIGLEAYFQGATAGRSHREVQLEELFLLWLANANPAFAPFLELFDDTDLEQRSPYEQVINELKTFFDEQPGFGPGGEKLLDLLMAPIRAAPHSLVGQLEFIRTHWARFIGPYLYRLLSSLDLIAEEQKAVFAGPGPIEAISFAGQELEPERYSPDRDWMPRLVLLARNTYVWLDQLSKHYGRPITTLRDIPDAELDTLAARGITGLWLIGLWERSKASQRIKQMMGNPEAVASAYSLYDYVIAADLGGPDALEDLKRRAWQRGIRLASDMVPNHMAIDSRWVMEHPEWFLSLPYSPFPSYTFNGPDLSSDPRVGIFLEDHYYDRTDAAVVFKRLDRQTGQELYIYHGNDGTSMPWNDTAQLNYLKPEVREVVIQTILQVARQFPIIRFDAAMTLAKRHIQRLWFPEPGTGGAIPSRAEHGMTRAEFDAAMPNEFWREVVDRVAAEAPDTLLLAEAFWLLEGYFVRTLGMHRVYNSAFMHMLRDEDNAKYRQLIKNTLEFDPEILKRYVNFMSNPDEETAAVQFGTGDKYFGVATVMATIPGLPMFGHGQFEGFREKYGMEYRRAYWDEKPDPWLLERHMREIVPLLKRRYLFAEVRDFLLYDFYTPEGRVDENVLAYSNRAGDERSLVVYHNRFADTQGWIRTSVAYLDKGSGRLVQKTLGEGLGLSGQPGAFVIFRDLVGELEYIRNSHELVEKGLFVRLGAYQRHVFLDFREVWEDANHPYGQLAAYLEGRGVPSIAEALKELFLRPIHQPYRRLIQAETFRRLLAARHREAATPAVEAETEALLDELSAAMAQLLEQLASFAAARPAETVDVGILARRVAALKQAEAAVTDTTATPATETTPSSREEALAATFRRELAAALTLPAWAAAHDTPAAAYLRSALAEDPLPWLVLFSWLCHHDLGRVTGEIDAAVRTRSWLDEWLLARLLGQALREFGLSAEETDRVVALTRVLVTHQDWERYLTETEAPTRRLLETLLRDSDVQAFLRVNRYGGVLWYNKEAFAALLQGLFAIAAVRSAVADAPERLDALYEVIATLQAADAASGYKVEALLENV